MLNPIIPTIYIGMTILTTLLLHWTIESYTHRDDSVNDTCRSIRQKRPLVVGPYWTVTLLFGALWPGFLPLLIGGLIEDRFKNKGDDNA